MELMTNTRTKTARACMRLHFLRYDLGWTSVVEAAALRFGDLFHLGLAGWWLAPTSGRLDAALVAMAGEADPFERAKAEALMIGYDARWAQDYSWETLAVEQEFNTLLRNPETGRASKTWTLGGKLDLVVRSNGRVLGGEHKTASDDITPGSPYWLRLRMDSQISIYYDGAAALGHQVEGFLYDVIGKPALRPSAVPVLDEAGAKIVLDANGSRVRTKDGKKWRETASSADGYVLQTRPETPEEYRDRILADIAANPNAYYQRGEVVRLESELAEARADLWQTAQAIQTARRTGQYPRNPDACVRYGRTCEFFEVCTGQASLEDATKFRRLESVHPELAEQPKEEAA